MRGKRFTIYDALEQSGYFDNNPANSFARDATTGNSLYSGPQQYPKMLYHPDGEQRITVQAEVIMTPLGPKEVGEQRELIWAQVNNHQEEAALVAEGWHDHPAKAVRRRVELYIEANPDLSEKQKKQMLDAVPPVSAGSEITRMEAELKRLQALVDQQNQPAAPASAPASPGPLQPLAAANALGARFSPQPLVPTPPVASPPA